MQRILALVFLIAASALSAQEAIPPGTILPLQLNNSLNSKKMREGQKVSARVMQDVPLGSGPRIRAGAKVLGRIVSVTPASRGTAAISLRFDTLASGKRRIPITTSLRALATMMDVQSAQQPATGPDRGTSDFYWTTQQIGGETVYRGGGVVTHGSEVVGRSVMNGVLVQVPATSGCGGEADNRLQALWVFSSDACGLYDLPDLTLTHAGRSQPQGVIRLTAQKGEVKVPAGSGLLLQVRNAGS
ncbi:MAG TPA: hypothetical protein VMU05_14195 [Dongiaceae bacterium]|nr:hypothetical protein [Dongiaceae bacterium]